MLISSKRIFKGKDYSISRFSIEGQYFCDVLEDTDRGLDDSMSLSAILSKKIMHHTAIPTGRYEVVLDRLSPKYSKVAFYQRVCGGYVPYLKGVKGFEGVLIHAGNTAADTDGCLLVGQNREKGKVLGSKVCFEQLYNDYLRPAKERGEKVWIEVG